jgi:hypothetical protein
MRSAWCLEASERERAENTQTKTTPYSTMTRDENLLLQNSPAIIIRRSYTVCTLAFYGVLEVVCSNVTMVLLSKSIAGNSSRP